MVITLGEISTALSLTNTIVQFILSLQGASISTRAARKRIESVQSDLNALRLLRSDSRLHLDPSIARDCDAVIREATEAFYQCAKPIEGCRVNDMVHGTVTVYRRITWVMRDEATLTLHEPMLLICHTKISSRLVVLQNAMLRIRENNENFDQLPSYEGGSFFSLI